MSDRGDPNLPAPGYRVVPEKSERAARQVRCPHCNGRVDRIKRRLFDRIVSLFSPVRRYRCWNHGCNWEANLRHVVTNQAMPPHRRAE
jgi:transposase